MDDDEPPTNGSFNQLVTQEVNLKGSGDLELVLMEPNSAEGILAVSNPTTCETPKGFEISEQTPWPLVYRYEKEDSNGRYSEIAVTQLLSPTRLSKKGRTIISRTEEYECAGCEDPSLFIKDLKYIPYVAWDRLTARICLAITEDFEDVEKFGVIGPQVPIEDAPDLIPNEIYKQVLKDHLKKVKEAKEKGQLGTKEAYIWDKDPVLDYDFINQEWVLIHRIDPFMHVARAKSLDDFRKNDKKNRNNDYWAENLRNIDNYRIDCDPKEDWEALKVGLSCIINLGDKKAGVYHGVDKNSNYSATICELDPQTYKIISRLRDPLLKADKDLQIFVEKENGEVKTKRVIFPRGSVIDEITRNWYIYSGWGDTRFAVRSTNIDWAYDQLNKPHNRIRLAA